MEASIIQIGNSRGIRIPKKVLEQYDFGNRVELVLSEEGVTLRPLRQPRQGWEEAFATMAATGDDELLLNDVFEDETFDDL